MHFLLVVGVLLYPGVCKPSEGGSERLLGGSAAGTGNRRTQAGELSLSGTPGQHQRRKDKEALGYCKWERKLGLLSSGRLAKAAPR